MPKPLARIQARLRAGLEQTAPRWPEVFIGAQWVQEAAAVLANPEQADGAGVAHRYEQLLADLTEEANPTPWLQAAAGHFTKVTASYWPGLFHCYDQPGLPRTNNDLEQLFGSVRHHLRRVTGRKCAPASLLVRGAVRLPAVVITRLRPVSAEALIPADPARWQQLRAELATRQHPRVLGQRFRRDPEAYLHALEDTWLKSSLRA
jgi:hypothetical protein